MLDRPRKGSMNFGNAGSYRGFDDAKNRDDLW